MSPEECGVHIGCKSSHKEGKRKKKRVDEEGLVNWCFKPSQPLGIISGLKETFIKRYIAEGANKAELRPQEQSKKTESCRENLCNEIQWKGPQRQKQTQEQNEKGVGKLGWFMSDINRDIPTT